MPPCRARCTIGPADVSRSVFPGRSHPTAARHLPQDDARSGVALAPSPLPRERAAFAAIEHHLAAVGAVQPAKPVAVKRHDPTLPSANTIRPRTEHGDSGKVWWTASASAWRASRTNRRTCRSLSRNWRQDAPSGSVQTATPCRSIRTDAIGSKPGGHKGGSNSPPSVQGPAPASTIVPRSAASSRTIAEPLSCLQ